MAVVDIILLPQDSTKSKSLVHRLIAEFQNPEWKTFSAAIAFVNSSGNLKQIFDAMTAFADRGGTIEMTFGADSLGGKRTSEYQAVSDIVSVIGINPNTKIYLYHEDRRTFHPKIYVFSNDQRALLIVGSSNWSRGGLLSNIEADAVINLDLNDVPDAALFKKVTKHFKKYWKPAATALPGQGFVEQVTALNMTEYSPILRPEPQEQESSEPDADESPSSTMPDHFVGKRQQTPNPFTPYRRRPYRSRQTPSQAEPPQPPPTLPPPVFAAPSLRWWKQLTRSDVMRKPADSHQRNHAILTRGGHQIDQKVWFRDTFFAPANWQTQTMRRGNRIEVADIPLEVFVNDISQGQFTMRFDHAPHRIAGQNNAPTWLQWSGLTDLIRSQDFTNWYLVLERFDPDTYQLRLSQAEPI